MDILGIGPLELVLILVVALLVFGPDKLPEIGAKLGKGVRELRQLSREISAGVNTITEPMEELRKPFDEAGQIARQISAGAAALSNPAQALQNSLEKQLADPGAEPAAAVSTAEENTIAPPRSPEPIRPASALAASASAEPGAIEPAAPAAQPSDVDASAVAVETLDVERLDDAVASAPAAPAAQASDVSAPATTPDTLNELAVAATDDPSAIESPAQVSER